jgi:hypothetical protein
LKTSQKQVNNQSQLSVRLAPGGGACLTFKK